VVALHDAPQDAADDRSGGRAAQHILAVSALDVRAAARRRVVAATLADLVGVVRGSHRDPEYEWRARDAFVHGDGVLAAGDLD